MPKQAMDYSKCVIYKIVCNDKSILECYVGHTTNFVKRKHSHKSNCKTNNFKLYQMIRENGGWDNFTMIPICEYPCENYIQACIKEEECRIELQASLNNNKCYADSDTKKYQKQYNKKYRQENKDYLSEKDKIYRDTHKEETIKRMKEWYEKNKEREREKKRLIYAQKKLVQTEN